MDDVYSVHQNSQPGELDVLANDQFDEGYSGDRQITSVSYGSEGGTVRIADDRQSILYAPPADFEGVERFVYVIDGQFTASVDVSVRSPLAFDEYNIPPDGVQRRLDILGNDPFWDGYAGPGVITSVSVASAGGSVAIAEDGKAVLYTPPDEAFGTDTFVYVVDGLYPARVTVSVPRTLESDHYELVENHDGVLDVLANDPFWPGYAGERKITHVVGDGLQGTAEIGDDGRTVLYTPPEDFTGWDSFRYVVDGSYEELVQVVIHRPVQDDWYETDQNSTEQRLPVTQNDFYWDLDQTRHDVIDRVTAVGEPESGGTVTISDDGQAVIYTPPEGFSGTDTFTYTADGLHEARVTVEVTRPVRDDYLSEGVYQDTPNARLDALANDFLGNGYTGPRQITSVGPTENGGQVTIAADGRSLLYTPAPGYVGQDRFTYTVDEELTATVSLSVQALAQHDHFSFCADPTQVPYTLNVLANDHFRRGYTGPGVITSWSEPDNGGEVTLADGQRFLFTPGPTGSDQFRYTVDGEYEATVSISLSGQLQGDSFVVDQNSAARSLNVLANDFQSNYYYATCNSQNYRGPRRVTDVGASEHGGSVTVAADGRSVHYEPPEDFHGSDRFTYTVDGLMQTTVHVEVIRRVRDDTFRVHAEDGGEALPVLVNDLFGAGYTGARQITAVTETAAGGAVTIADDGRSVHYTPPADFVGTDTFTYTVDGALKAEVRVVIEAPAEDQFPRFESLEAYQQFLIDDALERYEHLFGQPAWSGCPYCLGGPVEFDGAVPNSDRSHSETNVQVEGIDEGDIVEFDSDYIYTLTEEDLVIASAWPAEELSIASRVDIEGRPIAQYLRGDRLTVISEIGGGYFWTDWTGRPMPLIDFAPWPPFPSVPSETIVTVLDVTDRTAPAIVQTTSMEGRYIQSRGIGEYVYVLVQSDNAVAPPPLVIEQEPHDCSADDPIIVPYGTHGVYETREEYLARVTANPGELVDAALPNYSSYGPDGELVRTGLLTEPEAILRPVLPDVSNLINVVSFHVPGNEPGLAATSSVYASGAGTVYASLDNFYVFDSDYSSEDGALTRIMKFDWDADTGGVEFAATTAVPGSILNQFSADERDGYLRIATTIGNRSSGNWSGRDENTLFVLQEDEGVFETAGSLQNLALGETMRSVRYMGDRAFITTFRNVDPLFGVDLSDPTNPRAVGHLTLPGFSTYMQMIDDTHLLTVGRNTPDGFNGPTQVALFDVSDLSQPRQIDQYTFERFSTSEAEVDHHAFGYFGEHGVLAIPTSRGYVERVDQDGDGYRETRQWIQENSLAILAIDAALEDGVQWLAEIEHDAPVRRSGYIDDKLYSIAADSIKAVDVADPGTVVGELVVTVEEGDGDVPDDGIDGDVPIGGGWTPGDLCSDTSDESVGQFPAQQPAGPLASAVQRAQSHLADRLGLGVGSSMLVAAETLGSSSGRYEIVLRVGDQQYLYRAHGDDEIALVDSNYAFPDSGDADVRHAIPPRWAMRPTVSSQPLAPSTLRSAAR